MQTQANNTTPHNTGNASIIVNFRDFRLQTSDFRLQTSDFRNGETTGNPAGQARSQVLTHQPCTGSVGLKLQMGAKDHKYSRTNKAWTSVVRSFHSNISL